MQSFEEQFLIPGMHKLDGISVSTATSTDKIIENIKENIKLTIPAIHNDKNWREGMPIAIVGGGPSLKTELENLRKCKYIMACGSVHDYLMSKGIVPTWTVVCDPDLIMQSYLTRVDQDCTKFLIASQCDPSLFEYFKEKGANVTIWHLNGDKFDVSVYGNNQIAIGGGCTVGTRAMVIAMGMGFFNLHLYGMDTALTNQEHHAYEWNDPTIEKIHDTHDIQLEIDGPKFTIAGYHLGQLFDIRALMSQYANRMQLTVHGESFLAYYMRLAQKRLELYKKWQLENNND